MSKLDLNLMAVLEAIYDQGNTSRAAEALFLSQSAVSHALGRLRNIYDDPLFTRQGHSMMPTPTTERIIASVKRGLRELRHSVEAAQHFDPTNHQQIFRLSQRDAMETVLSAPLMMELESTAPLCGVVSVGSSPREVLDQLHQGEVDVCIELLQSLPEQIHHLKLFRERLAIVGRKDHPYFQGQNEEQRLLSWPQVLVTPLQDDMEWVDRALAGRGVRRNVVMRCRSYASALKVLTQTDKLSIMPRGYVAQQLPFLPITMAELPFEVPEVELHMYWHQRHDRDPANRWFRQRVVSALSQIEELTMSSSALAWLQAEDKR
jgi:DNA-binding transcriptional LysR family regulator